jgi:hypothetical protein
VTTPGELALADYAGIHKSKSPTATDHALSNSNEIGSSKEHTR